jgi:hypothetical protein
MRIVGCLLIIGLLFSYVPMISADSCPEGDHMRNMKMDCGYSFHCPMIVDIGISETLGLPLNGRLISTKPLLVVNELIHPIFHPPESLKPEPYSAGDEWEKILSVGLWHKNC